MPEFVKPHPSPDNEGYWEYDGVDHETEWEAYYEGVLAQCGCGEPEESFNFLRELVTIFDRRNKEFVSEWETAVELVKTKPAMALYAILNMLTNLGVLEHGGSVGGSWPTPVGEAIVDGPEAPVD